MEIKEIKNHPGYYITDTGVIIGKYGRPLKPWLDTSGRYYQVRLGKDSKNKSVHRLVAQAFVPNPNNYKEVNHIDYNTKNNSSYNLEWCTRMQNMNHCFKKHSPVRNMRKCEMLVDGKSVGIFESIIAACRYAEKHYDAKFFQLNKHRQCKGIKIIKLECND